MTLNDEKFKETLRSLVKTGIHDSWIDVDGRLESVIQYLNSDRLEPMYIEGNYLNPIFFSDDWIEVQRHESSQFLHRMEAIEKVIDKKELQKAASRYKTTGYSELLEKKDRLSNDLVQLIAKFLTVIDDFVHMDTPYKRESILEDLLKWSSVPFVIPGAECMLRLNCSLICGGNNNQGFDKHVERLNSIRSEAAKTNRLLKISSDILDARRKGLDETLVGSWSEDHRINSEEKSGRPSHEEVTFEVVKDLAKKYYKNENYIHQKGRHKGVVKWEDIANAIIDEKGWINITSTKTVERRLREAFEEFDGCS